MNQEILQKEIKKSFRERFVRKFFNDVLQVEFDAGIEYARESVNDWYEARP